MGQETRGEGRCRRDKVKYMNRTDEEGKGKTEDRKSGCTMSEIQAVEMRCEEHDRTG